MKKLFVLFFCISIQFCISAQDDMLADSVDTLMVTASKITTPIAKSTYSIQSMNIENKKTLSQNISINEYLENIPGLFAQNATNYAQDLRISIRGFGARSAFGIRGIKLIVDGIPETTPDGQGQIDNLDLSIIENIEVIRGPSASLYGNASGGVLQLSTQQKVEKDFLRLKTNVGSFNTHKTEITAGKKINNTNIILSANRFTSDGYRDHSKVVSSQLSSNVIFRPSENKTIRLLSNFTHSPEAQDPGGLIQSEVDDNLRNARDRNVLYDAGESISHFKTSFQYEHVLNNNHTFNSRLFYSRRNFDGKLPFSFGGAIDLDRDYGGHSSTFTYKKNKPNGVFSLLVGYDILIQNDNRDRYKNEESILGDLVFSQVEKFHNIGVYSIGKIDLTSGLNIDLNARVDRNVLSAEDLFLDNGDQSGNKNYNAFSHGLGINYKVNSNLNIYARYATSFETPTLSELSAVPENTGGFNKELNPQESITFDLGLRGRINDLVTYSITGFLINTKNEIVSFESEFRDLYRNAGKTRRYGIESNINLKTKSGFHLDGGMSIGKFLYQDYQLENIELDGESLPGIPDYQASTTFVYQLKNGFQFSIHNKFTSPIYFDDANENSIQSIFLADIKMKYKHSIGVHQFSIYGGINNIFNAEYLDNIRINAFGNRFMEPGPKRNYYLGIRYLL